MNIQSIVLLAVIIFWFVTAIIKISKKGVCSCGGGKCSGHCSKCTSCGCHKKTKIK